MQTKIANNVQPTTEFHVRSISSCLHVVAAFVACAAGDFESASTDTCQSGRFGAWICPYLTAGMAVFGHCANGHSVHTRLK